jgi:hypothetical protein
MLKNAKNITEIHNAVLAKNLAAIQASVVVGALNTLCNVSCAHTRMCVYVGRWQRARGAGVAKYGLLVRVRARVRSAQRLTSGVCVRARVPTCDPHRTRFSVSVKNVFSKWDLDLHDKLNVRVRRRACTSLCVHARALLRINTCAHHRNQCTRR